jgi:hypothetical protein
MPDIIKVDHFGSGTPFSNGLSMFADHKGNIDPGALRPWIDPASGASYITKYLGGDPKNPKSYRAVPLVQKNASLRRDEWKALDEAVLAVAETRLGGVQDLYDNGLVFDLGGNGMATTVLEHHTQSSAFEAEVTMDGATRAKNDRPDYDTAYTPLPITHVDYQIGARELAASRKLGNPLDTTDAERAARAVLLKMEQMLFTSTSYAFGGGTIYSYINHPRRLTVSMGTNWASDTTANILTDVIAMKAALIGANQFGPFALYIPQNCETKFDADYSVSGNSLMTLRSRILMMENVKSVKVVDTLPTGNAVMVNLNRNTVRMVRGMGMQNVEWTVEGGMINKYKVMTIQVPQIRADSSNQCGVCHCAV